MKKSKGQKTNVWRAHAQHEFEKMLRSIIAPILKSSGLLVCGRPLSVPGHFGCSLELATSHVCWYNISPWANPEKSLRNGSLVPRAGGKVSLHKCED